MTPVPTPRRKRSSGESAAARKKRLAEVLARLDEHYGRVECELDHRNAFELLVATILSAQCTDKRVNMVTPALFRDYPSPRAMASASQEALETLIKSTGFYRNKAKNILATARRIEGEYGGEVPASFEALQTLPGVARKTANVVMGVAFHQASGVVVDTHVKRISALLGLTVHTDPVKVERDLMTLLPQERWILFSHQLIHHGRNICIARRPKCDECPMGGLCPGRRTA